MRVVGVFSALGTFMQFALKTFQIPNYILCAFNRYSTSEIPMVAPPTGDAAHVQLLLLCWHLLVALDMKMIRYPSLRDFLADGAYTTLLLNDGKPVIGSQAVLGECSRRRRGDGHFTSATDIQSIFSWRT